MEFELNELEVDCELSTQIDLIPFIVLLASACPLNLRGKGERVWVRYQKVSLMERQVDLMRPLLRSCSFDGHRSNGSAEKIEEFHESQVWRIVDQRLACHFVYSEEPLSAALDLKILFWNILEYFGIFWNRFVFTKTFSHSKIRIHVDISPPKRPGRLRSLQAASRRPQSLSLKVFDPYGGFECICSADRRHRQCNGALSADCSLQLAVCSVQLYAETERPRFVQLHATYCWECWSVSLCGQ